MRWPEGPPHLALNPPYFLFVSFFFFCFFCFLFWRVGSGEVARKATSLDPKPSLFVYFLFSFLSLLFNTKKPVFPLEKGISCLFLSVSLCFSLAFFGLPLFQLIFLCLSLRIVLFFFLPVFLFCFILLVFVSFFPFLSSLLLFHEKNNIKIFNYKVSFISLFSFFGFLSCFLFEIPFSYLCIFPDFKLCFLFNVIVFGFKNPS